MLRLVRALLALGLIPSIRAERPGQNWPKLKKTGELVSKQIRPQMSSVPDNTGHFSRGNGSQVFPMKPSKPQQPRLVTHGPCCVALAPLP